MTSHIHRYDTEDGSTTLYDSQLDVHYRSTHGAKTESMTVFIHGTRLPQRQRPWTVLELGFGSAVNFMQTGDLTRTSWRDYDRGHVGVNQRAKS